MPCRVHCDMFLNGRFQGKLQHATATIPQLHVHPFMDSGMVSGMLIFTPIWGRFSRLRFWSVNIIQMG